MSMIINPMADIVVAVISQIIGVEKVNSNEIKSENEIDISIQDLKEQIRIVQDLAIAKRIETADEVEIEEYYENEKQGNLGLNGKPDGISLGVSGSGSKVVKRIYKFKGYNDKRIDAYEQTIDKVLKINTEESND